ncbi:hypothetical protein [Cohaesibacter celericrescens]|uniref:hypothetical protein n=1 Tax=Cohaesibacter celericrescens TaxID=2067669 RepID=UPI003566C47D
MASSVSLQLPQRFQTAFEEASRTTGTDFDFLLHTAKRESDFNASVKAPTSSATGLFQFVEQTWLETMKEAGPELGYSNEASKITQVGNKYYVQDAQDRQQILDMRKDPKTSALLAGALASKNETLLEQRLDRSPSSGELYAAHFLGAQGSGRLIELAENKPDLDAYKVFPQQAQANRSIFFEKSGEAKSVEDVYDNLVGTVPEEKKSLSRFFNLGEWFKPKASMQENRFSRIDAQASVTGLPQAAPGKETATSVDAFFAEPDNASQKIQASRFGLGYTATDAVDRTVRSSRLVTGEDGQSAIAAAHAIARSSRVFNTTLEAQATQEMQDTSITLPRRKPVTADVYVDSLQGVLPRSKPSASGDSQEQVGNADAATPARRFGALDLTAFLDGDVFGSTKKA